MTSPLRPPTRPASRPASRPGNTAWWRQTWGIVLVCFAAFVVVMMLIGAVGLWLFASGDSNVGRSTTTVACGSNSRDLFSTPCPPTSAEMMALSGVPIPGAPVGYSSTYVGFTDWVRTAEFRVPVATAKVYLNLSDFPGVVIDGPPVQATRQLTAGQFRTLELVLAGADVIVKITVFTT